MRIMVTGLRGFPDVQGGVERHAEQLYPLIAELGCHVEAVVRSPYHPRGKPLCWRGIRFRRLWAPKVSGFEALIHTFFATLYAALARPDVFHIHAVGPALMAPLARLFGLRVVVTHHGPDYDREKWSGFARGVLRAGERLGMRFAHERIAISTLIRDLIAERYLRSATVIPNGVQIPKPADSKDAVDRFGLATGRYLLQVSRMVPEKRQRDLIQAFAVASLEGWQLLLVGGIDSSDSYTKQVVDLARRTPGVVLAGFQTGSALAQLYSHAGLFVLPSSHEGLPIVLLEALSHGLPVLASDIPANLEIGLPPEHHFPMGDVEALAEGIRQFTAQPMSAATRSATQSWVAERYNWETIALQTLAVYQHAAPAASLRVNGRGRRAVKG